jgi:N-acetylglucosaminyldiphosphoundecaprenol N-acetyl-beta-D-mannosaminyltransferase
MRSLVVVAGIPVDDVTMEESVERIDKFVEDGRVSGRTHQIATVNVDFVVNGCADPALAAILQDADLASPDGMPIVWASKLFRRPLRERVAGADLVPELAAMSARRGYSVMLFGSGPGVAESVAEILGARHPGSRIIGYGGPIFDRVTDMDEQVLDVIRTAAPDILCVALGHPKQEHWIKAYRDKLDVPVLIGVGGSLDFIAGTKARAPVWIRDVGLEWLHRLVTEPRRLGKRYARDFVRFTPLVYRQLRGTWARGGARTPPTVEFVENALILRPAGALDLRADFVRAELSGVGAVGERVVVDMGLVRRLDHTTAASLIALRYELRQFGRQLVLTNLRPALAGELARLQLHTRFTIMPDVASALDCPILFEFTKSSPGQMPRPATKKKLEMHQQ